MMRKFSWWMALWAVLLIGASAGAELHHHHHDDETEPASCVVCTVAHAPAIAPSAPLLAVPHSGTVAPHVPTPRSPSFRDAPLRCAPRAPPTA